MAMADAFLGPCFDRAKLAKVEPLQLALHEAQTELSKALAAKQIEWTRYFKEVNKAHVAVAQQCEAILGPANFVKLFGITPSQIGANIDKDAFLAQA